MENNPSHVRQKILSEHNALRKMIAELREHTSKGVQNQDFSPEKIRKQMLATLNFLQTHMDHEDNTLLPILETIDAWGNVRGEKFREEHRLQTQKIVQLRAEIANPNSALPQLISLVEEFITWITQDMTDEEKEFLDHELLKDDLVISDYFGG